MIMAADEIAAVVERGRDAFDADVVLRRAVERCLEIIGEASKAMSQDVTDAHPEIAWSNSQQECPLNPESQHQGRAKRTLSVRIRPQVQALSRPDRPDSEATCSNNDVAGNKSCCRLSIPAERFATRVLFAATQLGGLLSSDGCRRRGVMRQPGRTLRGVTQTAAPTISRPIGA
ncbi:MAG: hypothetical protein KatS3mg011_1489 [Acidimicrobiia bacterium]|jgi:hypothetical protein|nr:MAG: hypothetical protein KatS3mg011_1489 [Acidimicrobiia bacterium]